MHVICVRERDEFICKNCDPQKVISNFVEEIMEDPVSRLVEKVVNGFLKDCGVTGRITARKLSSTNEIFNLLPATAEFFGAVNVAANRRFISNVYALFQNIDGMDTLFFLMYCQEYIDDRYICHISTV